MTRRTILITVAIGLVIFILGWFLHSKLTPSNQTKGTQMSEAFIDTLSHVDTMKSKNFAKAVSGHFILAESSCAGFNFLNRDIVLWTNEIACNDPDTLKIRWLDDSTFMTRSTLRVDKSCPPRVDIYRVVSFDGKRLALQEIYTGWNDFKDDTLKFARQSD